MSIIVSTRGALLAEVVLVVDGTVADEAVVGIDTCFRLAVLVHQANFLFDLVLVLSVPTDVKHPHFQFQNCKSNAPINFILVSM